MVLLLSVRRGKVLQQGLDGPCVVLVPAVPLEPVPNLMVNEDAAGVEACDVVQVFDAELSLPHGRA